MSGELMAREMAEQPAVLERIAERVPALVDEIRAVLPAHLDGIVFIGRGSSDNAAVLGRYATEISARRPAGLAAPSVHTRYASAVDYTGYLAVGLSQSGATPEVIATCERMRRSGAHVIAVTNDDESALAAVSDLVLSTEAGRELAVPATKTVTAEMALVLVIAGALGDGLPHVLEIGDLSAAVAAVLGDPTAPALLAEAGKGYDRLLVAARGLQYAAALETALKIKETSRVLAEGISIADLLHGPIAAVDSRLPVLTMDGGDPTADDSRLLAVRLSALDAPAATCSPEPESTLAMPAGLPEVLYPIVATVRGQQLAYHLSIARGLDPDEPSGLTKITPTD
jgi:glucosamine--fructose-6-phosphate aminotransferase (isomerizing)